MWTVTTTSFTTVILILTTVKIHLYYIIGQIRNVFKRSQLCWQEVIDEEVDKGAHSIYAQYALVYHFHYSDHNVSSLCNYIDCVRTSIHILTA